LLILLAKQLHQALKQSTCTVKLTRIKASHTPQEYRACATSGEVGEVRETLEAAKELAMGMDIHPEFHTMHKKRKKKGN
jgi:hypothetical protein